MDGHSSSKSGPGDCFIEDAYVMVESTSQTNRNQRLLGIDYDKGLRDPFNHD
jgi:hypothetical protein